MGQPGDFEMLALLAVLQLGEAAYGVTVLQMLEQRTSREVTLGAVYKTLGRLEAKGLVDTTIAPPTGERGGRRKKLYHLTAEGRETLRVALQNIGALTRGLGPELELS